MDSKDYSKEIYEKYFAIKDRILEITLKDKTVLEGVFVGVFHGDTEIGEPYVIKWHFVSISDVEEYKSLAFYTGKNKLERILLQKEIESVSFKTTD